MPVYEYLRKKINPKYPKKINKDQYKWFFYSGKYIDHHGKSQSYKKRGFESPKDAKLAEQKFLSNEKNTIDFTMTLDELFNDYMKYSKLHKEATTIAGDIKTYENYIQKQFGSVRVMSITTAMLPSFFNDFIDAGYAHGTIETIHKVFNKILNYGKKMYNTNHNPVAIVGKPKRVGKKKEMSVRTEQDFIKFCNVITKQEHLTLFQVLYFCGFRRGELLALRWNDYSRQGLRVDESVGALKSKQVLKGPKNENSYRTVSIPNNIREQLDQLYKVKSKEDGFNSSAFIFGSVHRPMGFETLRKAHVTYEKMAGVKHIRIHDFRHSHVSNLIAAKIPVTAVAARVGDTMQVILETYAHLLQENNDEIDELLENKSKSMPKVCQK